MTAARCSLGMAAESARRAPRKAPPKPAPPMMAPVRKTTLESVEAAMTISTMPEESATDPAAAPAHGGVRPSTSWATAAGGRAPEQGGARARGAGQREDTDAGHEVVARVEELARELRAERQEQ